MQDPAVTAELRPDRTIAHDATADDGVALLLAGLAVCTLQTLADHAEQHDLDVAGLRCTVRLVPDDAGDLCERVLELDGSLGEAHRAKLLEIAGRTPVTKLLQSNVPVVSAFR
jgi:putative redox protein